MSKTDGGPAFPFHFTWTDREGYEATDTATGMTIRDYFAGQVLAGMTRYTEIGVVLSEHDRPEASFAEMAYKVADAMLQERDK